MRDDMNIYNSRYKSLSSVVLETGKVRIEIVPQLGAKLVSLIYKPSGKEWLADSTEPQLNQVQYGDSFANGGMCGWDECFPTIDACRTGEHGAINLPDHGEVWSLPWDLRIEEGRIVCSVAGRQLPYKLTRQTEFVNTNTVKFSYRVENRGSLPFPFMWVAHPQFRVTEPTRILLPGGMSNLLCVYGGAEGGGGPGFTVPNRWIVDDVTDRTGLKFYYPYPVTEGWSGLMGEHSRNYVILTTASGKVPYLGIWIDKGLFNKKSIVALEPAIGYYDSLERTVANRTAVELPPGAEYNWELEISLGQLGLHESFSKS
ncbi:hypothetical protein [Paenibacillus sp. HW567]|uniref:hypothetical protein n=1 Tax=Paenibacillus sp. HW567 TaxID=1034769 RepID=UPI0003707122|nr:hypothetical protein [Paenibacillus sp. HW567]